MIETLQARPTRIQLVDPTGNDWYTANNAECRWCGKRSAVLRLEARVENDRRVLTKLCTCGNRFEVAA